MGDLVKFPRDREAALRIERVDPGPVETLTAQVAGRVPPHDLAAEAAVLSALLGAPLQARMTLFRPTQEIAAIAQGIANAQEIVLAVIKPEHFYSEANARIFQACEQLALSRVPIDVVSVATWLVGNDWIAKVGGKAYLDQVAYETPTVGHVEAHIAIVIDCYERRKVIATCQAVMVAEYGNAEPWGPRKAQIRATFGTLTAARLKVVGAPIGVAAAEAHASVNAAQLGASPGVPWGFDTLDHLGLLAQGNQHVLAARPGMGKTALAFQVCVRIADAPSEHGVFEAVYFCSWEMPRDKLLEREAASLAGVSFKLLQRRRVDADGLHRVARQFARLAKLPIWIDDEPCTPAELGPRVAAIKALFERGAARASDGSLHPRCRMRVVAIDQLSEVKVPEATNTRADSRVIVGATAKAVKDCVAKRLNVATLLLCQIGRPKPGVKVEAPTLSELRESGQIEEGADEVHAIHRPQYYERGCAVEWRNVARIIPLKGRYGCEDEARMGFYAGRFSDELPAAALGVPDYGH